MSGFKYRHLYSSQYAHQITNSLILALLSFAVGAILVICTSQPVQAAPELSESPVDTIYKVGATPEANEKIQYAWELSHDLKFIYTLNGENGLWTHDRIHDPRANKVGTDLGLCGTNSYWHPEIVTDPRFLSDWKWQMERCYQMWKGGVKFYAYSDKGIVLDK